jgi:hypothetical protein
MHHPDRNEPSRSSDPSEDHERRGSSKHCKDADREDGWLKIFCPERSCEATQNTDLA